MATVTMTPGGTTHVSRHGNTAVPYLVEYELDLAEAVTEKGSALAQGDEIEVIQVPAGTYVVFAGFEVLEEMTGTSTDATLDFGITDGDVDAFVDGFDLDAASAGDYASPASAAVTPANIFSSADTLDLLIATQTGTITGGKLRCFAIMVDISDRPDPGRAAIGS